MWYEATIVEEKAGQVKISILIYRLAPFMGLLVACAFRSDEEQCRNSQLRHDSGNALDAQRMLAAESLRGPKGESVVRPLKIYNIINPNIPVDAGFIILSGTPYTRAQCRNKPAPSSRPGRTTPVRLVLK